MRSTLEEIGDTALYAVYKLKEKLTNKSCVMRQIVKGELNHQQQLFYSEGIHFYS